MRHLQFLALALTLALAGCKHDASAPEFAHVKWTVSATTCTGTGTVNLIVDGAIVGTETLSAGSSSKLYGVQPGVRYIEARTTDGARIWQSLAVTLSPSQNYTRILDCY